MYAKPHNSVGYGLFVEDSDKPNWGFTTCLSRKKKMNDFRFKLVPALVLIIGISFAANIAYVPKVAPGNAVTAGAGKQWPTTRFIVDPSGNCISDNLTGLMWVRNSSLLGDATWGSAASTGTAQYKIDQMNTNSVSVGYQLCGYSDWRLPNINELLSLINYAATPLAATTPAGWLQESAGFTNVQTNYYYWTSTLYVKTVGNTTVWTVSFGDGSTTGDQNISTNFVWPVRGGK